MKHIIGNMTMDDLSAIRRMTKPDAERFLRKFALSDDERESVSALAGKDLTTKAPISPAQAHYDPYRRVWFAVGHLLGASFSQLAYPCGIRRQTVMASVNSILPVETRKVLRLASKLSLESLSTYQRKFYENREVLSEMDLSEAAQWLLEHTELDND